MQAIITFGRVDCSQIGLIYIARFGQCFSQFWGRSFSLYCVCRVWRWSVHLEVAPFQCNCAPGDYFSSISCLCLWKPVLKAIKLTRNDWCSNDFVDHRQTLSLFSSYWLFLWDFGSLWVLQRRGIFFWQSVVLVISGLCVGCQDMHCDIWECRFVLKCVSFTHLIIL